MVMFPINWSLLKWLRILISKGFFNLLLTLNLDAIFFNIRMGIDEFTLSEILFCRLSSQFIRFRDVFTGCFAHV
jgi:hypothetical protein